MKIVAIGSAREIEIDRLTKLFQNCIREPDSSQY
jgi:hypothetical protein